MKLTEEYKQNHLLAIDLGTGYIKHASIHQPRPRITENRGVIPRLSPVARKIWGVNKQVVVGPELTQYLTTRKELRKILIRPMRSGVVPTQSLNSKEWRVLKALLEYCITTEPKPRTRLIGKDFWGWYVIVALPIVSPRRMMENIFRCLQAVSYTHLTLPTTERV